MKPNRDLGQHPSEAATLSLTEHDRAELASRAGVAGAYVAEGDVLAGRYEIQAEIGRGGSSRVFRAFDRATRTTVAIKILTGPAAVGDQWMRRLGRELRLGRQGRHPNVCHVYDLMEAEGCRFLTMELATGGTLRGTLEEATDRSWAERIADARDVVAGAAGLHGDGIVHRDIKPENVLRRADGRLVLSDFGLAVAPGQTTFMTGGGAVGTPLYMAPEVAMGSDATMASDVFALGVILHEIFFGGRPTWETTRRGRAVRSPEMRQGSRSERSIARLCMECLDPLAPNRPPDAVVVKAKFERAVRGRYRPLRNLFTAGTWLAALVIAATAAGLVAWWPAESIQIQRATLVGEPTDWSKGGHRITHRAGGIHCVYPDAGGTRVKLIWGEPREAVQLDIRSGETTAWPLNRDSHLWDCPQFTSDGKSLVFARNGRIMLADGLGGSPREIGRGGEPHWLPGDKEVVHAFDLRRLAITDMNGVTSLLPEVSTADDRLVDLVVDGRSREVVALYSHGAEESSVLVFLNIDGPRLRQKLRLPVHARAVSVSKPGTVSVILKEASQMVVGSLIKEATFRREGGLGSGFIWDVVTTGRHRFVTHGEVTSSLSVLDETGAERVVARGEYFGRVSVARDGEAVFERRLEDRRVVVSHYDPRSTQIRNLTGGTKDLEPLIQPDGTGFLYIDSSAKPTLRLCGLSENSRCMSPLPGRSITSLMGVSPSGRLVALMIREGLRSRLNLLSLDDRTVEDFGPIVNDCRLRWTEEGRLWMFADAPDFTGWTEFDVRSKTPTGNRQATTTSSYGTPCPPPADRAGVLKVTTKREGALWRVPAEGL